MNKHLLSLALIGSCALSGSAVWADDAPLPGQGFDAPRYEALWTKSPFAVAAAEASQGSSDYTLRGVSKIDGVTYVNLVDNQSQGDHFLVTSDKPSRGLTLVSVTRGHGDVATQVVVQKAGQWITLKLDTSSSANVPPPPGAPIANTFPMPGAQASQIPMPGTGIVNVPQGGAIPGQPMPMPPPRFRPRTLHLPPYRQQQQGQQIDQPPQQPQQVPPPPQ